MKTVTYSKLLLFSLSLSLIISLSSCSKDEPDLTLKFDDSADLSGKIGDILILTGKNLNRKGELIFYHEDPSLSNYNTKIQSSSFIYQSKDTIKVKIPQLYHEDILVDGKVKLKLKGVIPIKQGFSGSTKVQLINEQFAYASSENKLYKSIDGYYKWSPVIEFSGADQVCFYFTDEERGWIAATTYEKSYAEGTEVFYTEDGGKTLTLKLKMTLNGGTPLKLQFPTPGKGYLLTNRNEIFVIENNTYKSIRSYYPFLPFPNMKFNNFKAFNNDLLYLSPTVEYPYLLRVENQSASYTELEKWPQTPQFFENLGYTTAGGTIYKTNDNGASWTKIYALGSSTVIFLDTNYGVGIVEDVIQNSNHVTDVRVSKDGGLSWKKCYNLPPYQYVVSTDFTNKTGLIASYEGRLWKFIKY